MSVQTSGAISYYDPVGEGFNPYTGVKNDFSKVTSQIPSNSTTRARAIVADAAPEEFAAMSGTNNPNQFYLDAMKALSAYGSGSGSGSGATGLGYAELAFKKQQDARDRAEALEALNYGRAQQARILSGLESLYGGGKGTFNQGFDQLLNMINEQGKASQQNVTNAYNRALAGVNEGYDVASGLGQSGFNALNQYLQANPNNPYAGMTAQVGSAPDALSNYLSAYGVSDMPVQGQIQADQLQAQQGAGNFQNLIDVLGGVAQQGAGSRAAESQMAQLLFNTGLGQERAGYRSEAENAQAQALAALQQAMFQSRFGVEGDRAAYARQLAETITNAGGNTSGSKSGNGNDGANKPPASVEQLLQEIAARQQAGTQMDPVLANSPSNPFMQYAV